jgi:hypothetical protein
VRCEIIQFSAAARPARKATDKPTAAEVGAMCERINRAISPVYEEERWKRRLPEPLTDSCRNQRLRLSRRDAWWAAQYLTAYWRARMDWQSALSTAQTYNIADARSYPACDDERSQLVDLWRAALVKQMLTPAPDVAAVAWKRAQMRAETYRYSDVKPERLQRAIDTDVEWLEAHPSKKSIAASRQGKKDG